MRLIPLDFRARDSPDDEEKEILSSTSPNIREVWDGNRIIRQTEESKTEEYIYNPSWMKKAEDQATLFRTFVIMSLEDMRLCTYSKEFILTKYRASKRELNALRHAKYANPAMYDLMNFSSKAPNLTLNIKNAIPEAWKVRSIMFIGLFVQIGVLTFNAIEVYHWRWLRAGKTVASYGYPVWTTGTLSLILGVTLCAQVIETSTTVYTLHPPNLDKSSGLRMFKIQQKIPSLKLPGFVLLNDQNNHLVHFSKREWPLIPGNSAEGNRSTKRLLLTYLGSILTLSGFICQNIGTRELHWSAGVAQLGATLILVLLRAWLRRHVGDPPQPAPVLLVEGMETVQIPAILENIVTFLSFGILFNCPYVLS